MTRANARRVIVAVALLAALGVTATAQSVIGLNPDFDVTAAEQEAYWYSRYNLGHLTMRAGMGETFMPDAEMVATMIAMADADPNDGDTVSPPVNPALLRTVYASGDPAWLQPVDSADFSTMRWDKASFDTSITGAALGWTIVKELEWAKQFHIDAHFGMPNDGFGAQWRFTGLALTAMAKMQARAWLELHDNDEMIMNDKSDPFVMLMAISNLVKVLGAETMPHSTSNRYRDSEAAILFSQVADEQFERVLAIPQESMTVKELSTGIQGLVWYASITSNVRHHAESLRQIKQLGEYLLDRPTISAADKGYALRGLVEVYRVLDDQASLDAVNSLFDQLARDFDGEFGIFGSQLLYSIDDVAAIVGGLNAAKLHGAVDVELAEDLFAGFFEGVVNLSGLQRTVPPLESGKSTFELGAPDIAYGYPTIPLPGALGEFGVAPVFATSVAFDPEMKTWSVHEEIFDTAGAMHAANEFIWLHADEVNGFPVVGATASPRLAPPPGDDPDHSLKTTLVRMAFQLAAMAALVLIATMINGSQQN